MAQELDARQMAADEVIACWPSVKPKQVFGHRGYVRSGHMFAFMADSGLAIKAASPGDAEALYEAGRAEPFVYNGTMEMRRWPVMPLGGDSELTDALSSAREAYESAE